MRSGMGVKMESREILSHVDHTLLKACASWEEVAQLCREAVQFQTAGVCIPPCFVARAHEAFPGLNLCTVVGFPLGYSVTQAKEAEVRQALAEGCNEIDMVVNLTDVKDHRYDRVEAEIRRLREICKGHILKVIIETCYLTGEEKIELCRIVTRAGADYIKTSTGFGTKGAALEDVLLFREHIGPQVKIKAAGGIRTREDMERFLEAGCERIGSSAAVSLLREELE